jgi:hypothetical protein
LGRGRDLGLFDFNLIFLSVVHSHGFTAFAFQVAPFVGFVFLWRFGLLHVTAFLTFTHPDSFQIFKGHGKLLDCKESRKKDDSEAGIEGPVNPVDWTGLG